MKTLKLCLTLLLFFSLTSLVFAQPGGRGGFGGGPPGFGGRGGFGGGPGSSCGRGGFSGFGGGSSDFRQRMMERMDRNGDGKLDESEVPDRAKGFVEGMIRQSGGSVSWPISISSIGGGRSRGGDRGRGGDRSRRRDNDDEEEFEYPLVSRFGNEEQKLMAFGVDPNMVNGRRVTISEQTYGRRAMDTLNRTMERYDKDKNGVLEYDEWREIPWESDPRVSDLDKDGNLTRAEMAERYKLRYGGSSSSSRSSRSSRDRGGSDRGGSDRGRSSSFGRGGPPSSTGFGGRGGGDRGGGDSRGGRSGFDPTSMLKRFDQDGDGYIDFDRMDDRVKGFAGRMLERVGIEAKGKVKIDTIRKKMEEARGGSSSGRSRSGTKTAKKTDVKSKLVEGADNFDGRYSFRRESEAPDDVPRWWDDRDKNGDGQVTMGEYFTSRSGRTRTRELKEFGELDLNGDGILVPSEAQDEDDK